MTPPETVQDVALTMLRLIAFLVTGFWPSAKSLMALNRRVDDLGRKLETLTKRHNSLAGSYYNDTEEDPGVGDAAASVAAPRDFPEDEFNQKLNERRARYG